MASALEKFDQAWRERGGVDLLGGVDEAGRGALAGPVVAACVVLPPGARLPGVNDSKQLLPEEREALVPAILASAAAWGVGWAGPAEIDRVNILEATLLAASSAVAMAASAGAPPGLLLTDFLKLRGAPCPVEPLTKGDARSQAIAAASVLAKVARDRVMRALDEEYPPYGFAGHKGYGTGRHWSAIGEHGPSTCHRVTFRGVVPEPFFGEEGRNPRPRVRCRSWHDGRLAALLRSGSPPPAVPPAVDWLRVLTGPPADLRGIDFLPDEEWQMSWPSPREAADASS